MIIRKFVGLGALLGALAVGVPATASAVTLGSVATADPGPCLAMTTGAFFTQTQTATVPYTVPAGGGLITSWSTSFGPAGAPVELLVTGPPSGMTFPVVGFDPETLPTPIQPGNVSTFNLTRPVPVQSGDQLGLFYSGASNTRCTFPSGSASDVTAAGIAGPPSTGATLMESVAETSSLANVSATLIQSTDIAVNGAIDPSAIRTGDLANFAFQVTANPAGSGTLTDGLPAGLTPVAASTGSGPCTISGQAVSCPVPQLPATVNITVKGATAGTYTNSATVASSIPDSNPANNTASTTLAVVNPPPTPQCTVPKLKGAPVAVAKSVLPLVNCTVGKVTKAKSKSVAKGDVISTNPGGGKKLAAGSKVAIKQSSGKPKKKSKKKH